MYTVRALDRWDYSIGLIESNYREGYMKNGRYINSDKWDSKEIKLSRNGAIKSQARQQSQEERNQRIVESPNSYLHPTLRSESSRGTRY